MAQHALGAEELGGLLVLLLVGVTPAHLLGLAVSKWNTVCRGCICLLAFALSRKFDIKGSFLSLCFAKEELFLHLSMSVWAVLDSVKDRDSRMVCCEQLRKDSLEPGVSSLFPGPKATDFYLRSQLLYKCPIRQTFHAIVFQ